ncbi:hypothetical protein GW916_09420 [bacterium]|nr:hypothetical protein [bacterium]
MSHNQDLSAFDLIVVLLLALGLGALAHLSSVPEKASTPGAVWPEAPSVAERVLEKQASSSEQALQEPLEDASGAEESVEVEAAEESWE